MHSYSSEDLKLSGGPVDTVVSLNQSREVAGIQRRESESAD